MKDDYITPEEAAAILKISKFTVYEMVKRSQLPASRVGRKIRIRRTDLDLLIQEGRTGEKIAANVSRSAVEAKRNMTMSNVIYFVGSHDLSIDILSKHLKDRGITLIASFSGSLEGLIELFKGRAEMAGCHLLDQKQGEYNLSFIPHLLPHEAVTVIRFVDRYQGFIVPKGNPRSITCWEEFLSGNHRIVNRQKGAGTRLLLDHMLEKYGVTPMAIPGYDREEVNHYATAAAVLLGEADAALGIESAARSMGLDFIPIEREKYDFVIPTSLLNSQRFEILLETLQDPVFKKTIEALRGYDISQTGEIIASFA